MAALLFQTKIYTDSATSRPNSRSTSRGLPPMRERYAGLFTERWQSEDRPGVTRAQDAGDHVMYAGGVSTTTRCSPCSPPKPNSAMAAVPSLSRRPYMQVHPGMGHHLRAIEWTNIVLVGGEDRSRLSGVTRPLSSKSDSMALVRISRNRFSAGVNCRDGVVTDSASWCACVGWSGWLRVLIFCSLV